MKTTLYTLFLTLAFLFTPFLVSVVQAGCSPVGVNGGTNCTKTLCTKNGVPMCCDLPSECSGDAFVAPYDQYQKALTPNPGKIVTTNFGTIITSLFPYVLTFAGIILFVMLILGGLSLLTGATNKESQAKGKNQITTALIGFLVIFAAYWIGQILQVILKIDIVGR